MALFLYNKNNFLRSSQSGHLLPVLICIVVIMGTITKAHLSIFTVEGMISFSHLYDLKKREKEGFFLPLTSRSLRQTHFLKMVDKGHVQFGRCYF